MAKRDTRRPQALKSRSYGRAMHAQDLRQGSRTTPIPLGGTYNRNDWRNAAQNGRYSEDED